MRTSSFLLTLALTLGVVSACTTKTETNGQGAGGDDSSTTTKTTTGGEEIPLGPPGTLGNLCQEDGTCDPNLLCGNSMHCQPSLSELPPEVVQTVPTPDSAGIPSSSPVLVFLNGTYENVSFDVKAYTGAGVTDITSTSTVTKLTSGADKDIFIVSSKAGFPLGASIALAIAGDLTGTLVFNVDHNAPASADGALGFEGAAGPKNECTAVDAAFSALPSGWKGFGDVGMIPATGSLSPTEGSKLAVMTTGAAVCGSALSDTSSLLVSGPIGFEGAGAISFDYNFQSSEFDDYCNSSYDDTFLAVLAGPKGAVAKMVNSVNVVCEGGQHGDGTFPTMPDGGDEVYKETGIKSLTLAGDVGSPAFLAFVVTDVGDSALSSVVGIDRVRIGQ